MRASEVAAASRPMGGAGSIFAGDSNTLTCLLCIAPSWGMLDYSNFMKPGSRRL